MNRTLSIKAPASVCFIAAAVLLSVALQASHPVGTYSRLGTLLLFPAVAACAAGIFISSERRPTVSITPPKRLLKMLLFAALVYHCVASISMLRYYRGDNIDVYLFQHHAARALLHAVDPYTLTTENIYGPSTEFYGPGVVVNGRVQIGMPYPPASLFFVIPAYVMGDIRYAYLAAVLMSAGVIAALDVNLMTVGVACFLLLNSVTLYVELKSWTEPFVLFTLTCVLYAAVKKSWWLPVALGIFLASKQYCLLALPFIPLLLGERRWKPTWRLLVESLGVCLAVTLPMAFWNAGGFWRDMVLVHIRQPFRKDALTLGNLLPIPMAAIAVLVMLTVVFTMRKARPHPSMFAAAYGFTLLVFVCTNKQAFCNYYFLIVEALLLSVAAAGIPSTTLTTSLEHSPQPELALQLVESSPS